MAKAKSESNLTRFCDWNPDTVAITRMAPEELQLLRRKLGLPDKYQGFTPAKASESHAE
jgi:hypothetical protein